VLSGGINALTNLDLSNNLKLEFLDISDNNFLKQDLTFLSHLVNLQVIMMGNNDKNSKTHNDFVGGLEPLKNMSKLELYSISGAKIDPNSEHLPNGARMFEGLGQRIDLQTSTSSTFLGGAGVSFDAINWILKDPSGAVNLVSKAKAKYRSIREEVLKNSKSHSETYKLSVGEFQEIPPKKNIS